MFFKRINIKYKQDDYVFRFSSFFDESSREFEEKIRQNSSSKYLLIDDSGMKREVLWPSISFWQSYRYLEHQTDPFYVLQMRNQRTDSYYQIVIQVEVSKISFFQSGNSHKWIMATSSDSLHDQHELIKQLLSFCKIHTKLMTIRIQQYMPGDEYIEKTSELLLDLNFKEISPKSYTKTRMLDLRTSVDNMLASFSANGRARLKIKQKDIEKVEVKAICDRDTIPYLQNALNDSFLRSVNKTCPYNFNYLFSIMAKFEKEIIMLGFYIKKPFSFPMAFITGVKHDSVVEFSVGGSLSDSKLRQFPFNHLLMWQLALESKKNGSLFLDMGGIAIEPNYNSLSGITNFKRLFPGFEFSVGKEMQIVIHPIYLSIYSMIQNTVTQIKSFFRGNQ